MLGGERLLTQQEVDRLQGLRGHYGIASPAPICDEPPNAEQAECQVLEAPNVPGQRLVADSLLTDARNRARRAGPAIGPDDELRLTYRELTALIEAAVRNLT